MYPSRFRYEAPTSLEEAISLLGAHSINRLSSAPPNKAPRRPPPGVMATASAESKRGVMGVSRFQATSTRVPLRRQAATLTAIPNTPSR